MNRIFSIVLFGLVVLASACTSSSSPSSTNTNNNYDQQFREQTRSSAQNYEQGGQLDEGATGDPIVTLMLLAMETGDVHPGEDYFVYAVVDKPRERSDVEYVWSVENGDFAEVQEAERGRIETIIETEYSTATPGAGATPSGSPVDATIGEDGDPAEGGKPLPTAGGAPAPVGGPGTASDPFAQRGGTAGPGGSGVAGDTGAPLEPLAPVTIDEFPGGKSKSETSEAENPPSELAEPVAEDKQYGPLQSDPEQPVKEDPAGKADGDTGFVLERRVVGGPAIVAETSPGEESGTEADDPDETIVTEHPATEDEYCEPVDANGSKAGGEAAGGIEAAADRVVDLSNQVRPSTVAEGDGGGRIKLGSVDDAVLSGDGGNLLRYEYDTWKEDGIENRRRPLAGYGELNETELLTADESYEGHVFVTDNPYVLWTPELPGETNIYVKVQYKGEDLTEPRALPVSVRLKDPTVTLSEEFPDVVREDESVYLELTAENIPAFSKGLFTIQFDPVKLSFRDAELGEYFDDAPSASMYHAQPDKSVGRVLLAVDAGTKFIDLSGDGTLAYIKFKAKEDLSERAATGLALVADANARYILNSNGENVLPLPAENPPFRTEMVMPPTQPNFDRGENVPGRDAPATSGQPAQQQPAGGQSPQGTQTYSGTPGTVGGAASPATSSPAAPQTQLPQTQQPPAGTDSGGVTIDKTLNPATPTPNPAAPGEMAPGLSVTGWNFNGPPEGYHRMVASEDEDGDWLVANVQGRDEMHSQQFVLEPGLAVFSYDFTGRGDCTVLLKDSSGTSEQRLLRGIDQLGARAFHIAQAGEYFFDVIADGEWEVRVWQPTVGMAPYVDEFEGEYSAVTVFSNFEVDQRLFHLTHQGTGDFVVTMLDWEGNPVKQLVNVTGFYDDYVEYMIPNRNVYLFDIYADGKWSISIE